MGNISPTAQAAGRIYAMKVIKKEIMIEAPIAKVWAHITDPSKIARWLMPNDFAPSVGKRFFMECEQQGKISCVVKEIVPTQKLAYSFHSTVTQVETLVTFLLTAEGNSTRVTLIHSGWDALPPTEQGIADLFGGGWDTLLGKLRAEVLAGAAQSFQRINYNN